jgi:hypothetical protein
MLSVINLSYIQYIQRLCKSKLNTVDYALFSSLRYNGSPVTYTVVCLTAAKVKPFVLSLSGFALSNVANIFIVMI